MIQNTFRSSHSDWECNSSRTKGWQASKRKFVFFVITRKVTPLKEESGPPVDSLLRFLLLASTDVQPPCANCDKKGRPPMYYCNTCGESNPFLLKIRTPSTLSMISPCPYYPSLTNANQTLWVMVTSCSHQERMCYLHFWRQYATLEICMRINKARKRNKIEGVNTIVAIFGDGYPSQFQNIAQNRNWFEMLKVTQRKHKHFVTHLPPMPSIHSG